MAKISETAATLRIFGDDLEPDKISKLLGHLPSKSERKGDRSVSKSGNERVAKTGLWRLHATDLEPGDINAQIQEILDKLSPNIEVWNEISKNYRLDLFCGLFMKKGVEETYLTVASMSALSARNIELNLDIYGTLD